jgi:hypothetical protein
MSPDSKYLETPDAEEPSQALLDEREWFQSCMPRLNQQEHVTIFALLLQLDKCLGEFIIKNWVPAAEAVMDRMIAEIDSDVEDLDIPVLSARDQRAAYGTLLEKLGTELSTGAECGLRTWMSETGYSLGISGLVESTDLNGPYFDNVLQARELRSAHISQVRQVSLSVTEALQASASPIGSYISPEERIKAARCEFMPVESILNRYPKVYEWLCKRITAVSDELRPGAEEHAKTMINQAYDAFLYTGIQDRRLTQAVHGVLADDLGLAVVARLRSDIEAVSRKSPADSEIQMLLAEHPDYVTLRNQRQATRAEIVTGKGILAAMKVGTGPQGLPPHSPTARK